MAGKGIYLANLDSLNTTIFEIWNSDVSCQLCVVRCSLDVIRPTGNHVSNE